MTVRVRAKKEVLTENLTMESSGFQPLPLTSLLMAIFSPLWKAGFFRETEAPPRNETSRYCYITYHQGNILPTASLNNFVIVLIL
jgi:hypothetical protein